MRQITYGEFRHPIIYQWDPKVTNDDMMKSFGIGEGWWPLVHKLIGDIFDAGWDGKLLQVKEKFGGLRFYIGPVGTGEDPDTYLHNPVYKAIFRAEQDSTKICEECGAPGEQRYGGWIKTLCDAHHEERNKKNAH